MILKIERKNGWLFYEVDNVNLELKERKDFNNERNQYTPNYFIHDEIEPIGSEFVKLIWPYKDDRLKGFIVVGRNKVYLCGDDGRTLEKLN